jgi:hypothetical protein
MQQTQRRVEHEEDSDDGSFDILSERQLKHDGRLKQARYGRHEFAQHEPHRMDVGVRRCIGAGFSKPAARFGSR